MTKKYKDFTDEEKAQYKEKRDAYWAKREAELRISFEKLEAELKAIKASDKVFELLKVVKKGSGLEKGQGSTNRETYLTAFFGTETPDVGQKSTYQFVSLRGPNGERINDGETIGKFVVRVGEDITFKYDKNKIAEMAWYCARRGHKVEYNHDLAIVTYKGKIEVESK